VLDDVRPESWTYAVLGPCAKGQVRARGHEINIVGLPPFEALKDLTTDILLFIEALLTPGFLATSKEEWALDVMQGRTRLELQLQRWYDRSCSRSTRQRGSTGEE